MFSKFEFIDKIKSSESLNFLTNSNHQLNLLKNFSKELSISCKNVLILLFKVRKRHLAAWENHGKKLDKTWGFYSNFNFFNFHAQIFPQTNIKSFRAI